MIETDGVTVCVHYRRLKKDRPVPPSAAPVTKDEEKEEADPAMHEVHYNDLVVGVTNDEDEQEAGPATQEVEDNELAVDAEEHEENQEAGPATQAVEDNDFFVDAAKGEDAKKADSTTQEMQDKDLVVDAVKHEENKKVGPATQRVLDNDFVVGADPGNTNIITIAALKRAEDGTDGNLRQKDMLLLRFSRERYYRDSGIMNARKKIETWNSGMKDHLEAWS